jgi:nitroimidazol reductase NimA-like FMN-containing flavoprotein (pyridoxamine 5'-phosphate oxidase superfamily)
MAGAVGMKSGYHISEDWTSAFHSNGPLDGAILHGILGRMTYPVTERTRLHRRPMRASYDVDVVHYILDAGIVCEIGFVEQGRPVVIPTAYVRIDDALVVHGARKNRTLVALAGGAEFCCTVTLLDGLVLARSAFHHSVNYRSVVAFGRGEAIEDETEKLTSLRAFFDRLYPGRWDVVRPPTPAELLATLVVRLPLGEVSAKRRSGPALDDEADYALPVWAGVAPVSQHVLGLEPDARLHPDVDPARGPSIAVYRDGGA